jgi:hypothetical protein
MLNTFLTLSLDVGEWTASHSALLLRLFGICGKGESPAPTRN